MRTHYLAFLLICGFHNALLAATAETLLREVPTKVMVNEVIELRPIAGHHFNLKAKLQCGSDDFIKRTALQLDCQLHQPGTQPVVVSICDDAVSFCKVETHQIQVTAPQGWRAEQAALQHVAITQAPKGKLLESPPGFINNDAALALQKAQAAAANNSHVPSLILIDFFGTWCPPCNMLDEYVFHDAAFLQATEKMTKVRLDVDSDLSWAWQDHFRISRYPTLVVANEKLEEIDRLVGYEPLDNVVAWLQIAQRQAKEPVEQVKQKLDRRKTAVKEANDDADYFRVGTWLADRDETEEALQYLGKAERPDARRKILELQYRAALKNDDKAAQIALLQQFLDTFADDIEFAQSVVELNDLDKNLAKKYAPAAIKNLDYWKESSRLAKSGWSVADVYGMEGDFYAAFEQPDKAKVAYSRAADLYGAMATKSHLKVARGANLERLIYLRKAERFAEAKKLAEGLASSYGDEFTFNFNYGRLLYRLKEYKKARPIVEKALANAYGNNFLYASELLMQIFIAEKDIAAAEAVLQKALNTVVLPVSTNLSTHEAIARMRKVLSDAQSKEKSGTGA